MEEKYIAPTEPIMTPNWSKIDPMVDTIEGFEEYYSGHIMGKPRSGILHTTETKSAKRFPDARFFCPVCRDIRYCSVECNVVSPIVLFDCTCRQCHINVKIIQYRKGFVNQGLVILHCYDNKDSDHNIPQNVSYYLEQATMAKSSGAHSASMAMYRTVLECLLFNNGFTSGNLKNKIDEASEKKPEWMNDLDSKFMDVVRLLGNSSVHVNEVDIEKQEKFDEKLLQSVEIALSELIERIYLIPAKRAANLRKLEAQIEKDEETKKKELFAK